MIKEFKTLLAEFVGLPSVSADQAYVQSMRDTSAWLVSYCKQSGLKTEVVKGYANPIVVAKTKINPALKTILVYGHYDVQPASRKDGWASDPFVLTEKSGRLYGRGSADNKAQILTHLYCVGELGRVGTLGFNVIFVIEGNEETGSSQFRTFLEDYATHLACDCVLISDGELARGNKPALEASFRGVANVEVTVRTAKDDLHSGLFGGAVPNAGEELAKLISLMHDADKRIMVPGFYDGVEKVVGVKSKKSNIKLLTGTQKVFADSDAEYETRTGLEPALEVTTFSAGYMGTGFRNSIPSVASAKVNIRSAPNQKPKKLVASFKKFVKANVPGYVTVQVTSEEASIGATLDLDNPYAVRARAVLKKTYGVETTVKHSGGTLPIVRDFDEVLGVPQVMVPLANEDCGMHSASENITVKALEKGLMFSRGFFTK